MSSPADAAGEGRSEQEIYEARLHKAEELRAKGVDPWGNGHRVEMTAAEVQARHGASSAEDLERLRPHCSVAGRIVAQRSFGKAAFLKLRDRSGEIQVYVRKDALGEEAFGTTLLCDVGDIVAAEGYAFRTKTGELSIHVERFVFLTKALRPLPEKWHGLADLETRYRQRYLDLIANPGVRDTFLKRSRLVAAIRAFLDARDFIEVETPMMQTIASGAVAKPFITHHNALDLDLFLRIAPELYLKRLVVGGFERVYEINRNFRNEGISTRHNPEFTMLEFYQAHATYEDLITLTEQMLSEVTAKVCGSTRVTYQGVEIDFAPPWRRVTMGDAIREARPEISDAQLRDPEALRATLRTLSHEHDAKALAEMELGQLVAALFEATVEKSLVQPTFVTRFPTAVSPLARRSADDPTLTDRFELYVAGREIANAFSELNDPIDQRERFERQSERRQRGDEEAMAYDADYLRALEHGLPPTAGEGIGIDRLAMLLTDSASIRDVILFPLLRAEKKGA
jgi:lysyl-tRNA synthetase, class II